jgi:hypothetical protein
LGTYPDVEVEVLVRHGFDVEADCGDRGDYLADLILLLAIHLSSSKQKQGIFCPLVPPLSVMWGSGVEVIASSGKGGKVPLVCTAALSCPRCPVRVSSAMSARAGWIWDRPYQSQDQYPRLLLRPDQPGELRNVAAHGVCVFMCICARFVAYYLRRFSFVVRLHRRGSVLLP